MRQQCVDAVTTAAEAMGRKLSQADLKLIEDRIKGARVQLARRDIDAYRNMTGAEQVDAAAKLVAQELLAEKVLKKQREALTIQKTYAFTQEIEALATATGESRVGAMFRALFQKLDGKGSAFALENRIRATRKYYQSQLHDLFDLGDRGYLGSLFADPKSTRDLMAELYGKDSGNPMAKKAAEAVNAVLERQIKEYQAEGGVLNRLENWRHPQYTSPRLAHRMGRDEWVAFVRGKLDRAQYLHDDGRAFTEAEMTSFLEAAWRSIALDGAGKPPTEGNKGAGALGNTRKAHRQLFFKDDDAWMEYHNQLGEKDMLSVMMDHVDGLSTDIATMKVLSHNPKVFLQNVLDAAAAKDAKSEMGGAGEGLKKTLTAIFGPSGAALADDKVKLLKATEYLLGGSDVVSNHFMARFLRGYRNLKVASLLGSLPGSMLPDQGTMLAIARQNRMQAGLIWQGQKRWATNPAFRENLRAMGLALEGAGEELSRIGERDGATGKLGLMATAVHRLSGATAINTMERAAMEYGLTATWARLVQQADTLDKLDPADARILKTKGLTDTDWQVWRLAELDEIDGVKMLTPKSIDLVPDAEIAKVIPEKRAAIEQETADFVAKMEARNAKENEWLAGRLKNFEDYKARAQKWLDDYRATRERRTGEAASQADLQADLLQARLEQAEASADIATYLKTSDSIDAQRRLLEAVEDGASLERGTVRRRDWADRAPDAVVTDWAATPGVAGKSKAAIERLARDASRTGEALGRRQAKAEVRIRDLEKRLKEMERTATKEVSAKERELNERVYKRLFDLADFAERMNDRVGQRTAAMREWQDSVGPKIQRAAEQAKQEAILKLYGALDGEVNTAILQPSAMDRVTLGTTGNDVKGEILRTVLQFKSFPWAYFRRHTDRMMMEPTLKGRVGYAASTMALTTAYAGAGIALLAMARGEDPQDITEKPGEFATKAFLKGGGLGFYGDLLLTPDQFGAKPSDQLWGPVIGDLNTAVGAFKQTYNLPASDDPEKSRDQIARDMVKLLKQNTPFQNLWYTRATTDRLLFNQMQEMANPGAMERVRERAARQGTSYWWAPGELAPERAPDIGKAVGESATQ